MRNGKTINKSWKPFPYTTVLEGGIETNNMIESFNRTWNSLSGHSLNDFTIQELFVKQDAEDYLSNALCQDMVTNSDREKGSMDSRQRIKFVVEAFHTNSIQFIL